MKQLDGKVALITGAARGQGRAHAVHLARAGAAIIALDVGQQDAVTSVPYPLGSSSDLEETSRLVRKAGGEIIHAVADVRDVSALEHAVRHGISSFGRLDIVVANAGISSPASCLGMSEDTWQEMIDVNLTGVWKTLKVTVPHIIDGRRGGSIVIVSSGAAEGTFEHLAHYSVAKAGLLPLMRILAKELAPHNIRVNSLHTATVATPMVFNDATYRAASPHLPSATREDFEERVRATTLLPIGAIEPDDVANAVLYLVGDSGRCVTGTKHYVDAGAALRG
ncbi:mycofactocin-coupled SDR family oxidoreductase [Phytohabitans kaempferiae]|uniref:Mycofactocin-coupled SDR family oxidoreductase n=1 Tax=Phytohabitans kaempferiae TaxID=1620943 RepID=A0ABV6MGX8_9ACTN